MATGASAGSAGSTSTLAPPAEDRLPRPFGRLWLLKRLARGGMGEVYLASTTGIEGAERPCVVKIIRREHAQDRSFLARFLDEARVQAQLQHPGVAQILEAATDASGEPYVVVEHVEGRSLGEVRGRATQLGVRIGWADAVAIAASLAEGLAHVHERVDAHGKPLGIVHRDLSPQNVMLGYGGDLKLIDFGTARGENRRCHTIAGVVFAKPGYVAPEVANNDPGDHRVDLYALGIILWELLAGRRFLQGDATEHLAAVARDERRPPPVAQLVGAPAALDGIVARLVAHDRAERYPSARAAAGDLVKVLAGAESLPGGERGVRARIARLMNVLYPSEPARSRSEFATLVAQVRAIRGPAKKERAAAAEPRAAQEAGAADRLPGTPYRLMRTVGEGAMGVVHEAVHVELERRVALKVLSAELSTSPEYASRFRREARALASLSQPGLPTIHDFGQSSDGRLWCAMELLEGETLEARLEREQRLGWRAAAGLAVEVLHALGAAHAAGVVHRDVKPANLFLGRKGGVRVLDFGVARTRGEIGETRASASGAAGGSVLSDRALALVGTPEYMAPEQARAGAVDARADLYALGCVLYEAIGGARPFAGGGVEVIDAKTRGTPRPLRELATEVPPAIERVILRALAPHPVDRFVTAGEMRVALEKAVADTDRAHVRRRRSAVAAACALAVAVGLVGVGARTGRLPIRVPRLAEVRELAAARLALPAAPAEAAPASAPVDAVVTAPAAAPAPAEPAFEIPATPIVLADAPPEGAPPAAIAAPPQAPSDALSEDAPSLAIARERAKAHRHDAAALRGWTVAAMRAKAWDEARRAAEAWRFVDPGTEPLVSLARSLAASGRRTSAVSILEDVVERHPACDEARVLLSQWAPEPARHKGKARVARNDAR